MAKKEMLNKNEAQKLMEILESGQSLMKATIRTKPQGTEWVPEGKESGNKQVQVNLDGMRSFRLTINNEAMEKLVKRLVPGRQILFTYGNIEKADAKATTSTFSGGKAKAPVKFTNFFDVDIIYVGKGEELSTMFDDDLEGEEAQTVEIEYEKKASGQGRSSNIPEVGAEGETKDGEGATSDEAEY